MRAIRQNSAVVLAAIVAVTALIPGAAAAEEPTPAGGFGERVEPTGPLPEEWTEPAAVPTPWILNGIDGEDGQYPWMALLRISKPAGTFTCGGSVISDRFVLTAAHCVENATAIQVFTGGVDRPPLFGSDPRWVNAAAWTAWDTYADYGTDDVALVETAAQLGVDAIPLAATSDPHIDAPGRLAAVAGWGITSQSGSPIPVTLQRTYIPVRTEAECIANYPGGVGSYVHDYNVCAGFMDGEGSGPTGDCAGDSGSPLMSHDAHGMTQIGLVSYGNGPCTDLDDRGVYMRVDWYRDAIADHLNDAGSPLPPTPPPQTCSGRPATRAGTPGDDTIVGSDGPDVIVGLPGDDSVDGLGDDDIVCGGAGGDELAGGAGLDTIRGQAGPDLIEGNDGPDRLFGDAGPDEIRGDGESDVIRGGAGDDVLRGNRGDDTVRGELGDDRVLGHLGQDDLHGNRGVDVLRGHWNADVLAGGLGADLCDGGAGNDIATACENLIAIP